MDIRHRYTRAGQQVENEMRERGAVSVYHPDYADHGAVLLSLPATDGDPQMPGVHRNTIHTACAIIADNRFDGYLSTSRDPNIAHETLDHVHVLPAGIYYFHLPRPLAAPALTPYPIVPSFRTWKYPHDKHISGWEELRIQHGEMSGSAEAVLARDQACRMTASKEATQAAHIIPRAEREWFALNSMPSCCLLDPTAGASSIDRSSNGILLRSDIHRLWDTYQLLFVPKSNDGSDETCLVAHVSVMSAELVQLYHNVPLQELIGIPKEYLFARLAYGILRQLRTFLQSGRDRWLVIQNEDGSVNTGQYAASVCAQFAEDQGVGRSSRSPTKSPSKSPKRKRDTVEGYTADQLGADHQCISRHETRKRQRCSSDSFDSAIAGITEWVENGAENDDDAFALDMDWADSEQDSENAWPATIELNKLGAEQPRNQDENDERDHNLRGRRRVRYMSPRKT